MIEAWLTALGCMGTGAFLFRSVRGTNERLPLVVFLASYTLLFFVGAMGMHLDAQAYFQDWVASIGVQEAYLSKDQASAHLWSICSPYVSVPFGAWVATRVDLPRGGIGSIIRPLPSWIFAFLGWPFGTFFGFLGVCITGFHYLSKRSNEDEAQDPKTNIVAFLVLWVIAALLLIQTNALGSFFSFFRQYSLQEQLMDQRGNISIHMPFAFWILAYTVLPVFCAAALLSMPQGKGIIIKFLLVFATSWILFANFYKSTVLFFFIFLIFCFRNEKPKSLVKPLLIVVIFGFITLSAFYLTASSLSQGEFNAYKLIQHYFYRLGTTQYYYTWIFPEHQPWMGLDISNSALNDAQVVYQYMYPGDSWNGAGSTAGPYICNAYAQAGVPGVWAYGIICGALIQSGWRLAKPLPHPLNLVFRGRILFIAFMAAQMAIRDLLFSGWGITWAVLAILLIRSIQRNAHRHPMEESPGDHVPIPRNG
ncbi:MAG TPA: hypothetical protein VJ505_16600 [Holophagaceae bacterium]|nr:hypothetical protein [Holophagaceae bacterium]